MNDVGLYMMNAIDSYYKGSDNLWFVGTKSGAHNQLYFANPGELTKKYNLVYISSTHIKTTAAVYCGTDRTLKQANGVWTLTIDMDFDMDDDLKAQERRVADALDLLPPSFLCQTPHGFHAYFLLEKLENLYSYSYTAEKIIQLYNADAQSKVVTQCMSLYEYGRSEMVEEYHIAGKTFKFNKRKFPMYTYESINKKLGGYSNLVESLTAKVNQKSRDTTPFRADTKRVLQQYDVADLLRSIGMEVKEYDDKIITTCPYHQDRNPSAFINIDEDSEWYGLFVCRSSSCGVRKSVKNLVRDILKGYL